jgi:hypothetical protein
MLLAAADIANEIHTLKRISICEKKLGWLLFTLLL